MTGIMTNKKLWKNVKPFISHKTNTNDCLIILNENNEIVKYHSAVADILREQSLSIGETGAEGNELGYETTAFAVTGVWM